jgi:hypothetical protein
MTKSSVAAHEKKIGLLCEEHAPLVIRVGNMGGEKSCRDVHCQAVATQSVPHFALLTAAARFYRETLKKGGIGRKHKSFAHAPAGNTDSC